MRGRVYARPVTITADQLRDARVRAGFTSQAAFAEALGVSERTVSYWEAEGGKVSARAEARVRDLLWPKQPERDTDMSDATLIAEMIRLLGILGQRLAERNESPPMQPSNGETQVYEVRTGDEQLADKEEPPPGSSPTTSRQRRIRGRGPRRTLGQ